MPHSWAICSRYLKEMAGWLAHAAKDHWNSNMTATLRLTLLYLPFHMRQIRENNFVFILLASERSEGTKRRSKPREAAAAFDKKIKGPKRKKKKGEEGKRNPCSEFFARPFSLSLSLFLSSSRFPARKNGGNLVKGSVGSVFAHQLISHKIK